MAITNCPECLKEISDKASKCPQCGYPIRTMAVHKALARRANNARTNAQKAFLAITRRRRRIRATAICLAIFVVGTILFPLISYFGAICMAIYAVALFATIRSVWRTALSGQDEENNTQPPDDCRPEPTVASKQETTDDERFMPPEMRANLLTTVSIDEEVEPVTHTPCMPDEKRRPSATDNKLTGILVKAALLLLLFGALSVILRPIIDDNIRKSCMPQRPSRISPVQRYGLAPLSTLATNPPLTPSVPNHNVQWRSVTNIPNVVFGFPSDKMEVQSAIEQNSGNAIKQALYNITQTVDTATCRLQQKGLTAKTPDAFNTYMRIAVTDSEPGVATLQLLSNLSRVTSEDLDELDLGLKQSLLDLATDMTLKGGKPITLVQGPSSEVMLINGVQTLKTTHKRRLGTNPTVIQTEYKILRTNRLLTITTQFRESERERWESAVDAVVNSVRVK